MLNRQEAGSARITFSKCYGHIEDVPVEFLKCSDIILKI
jgi:hypothetical protein